MDGGQRSDALRPFYSHSEVGILFAFDGLIWLLIALSLLVMLQRTLHREIQAAFLILTRRPGIT